MGYFKQQEIAEQENIDRIVAWYSSNWARVTDEHMDWLLEDEDRLWREILLWEYAAVAPPKPARSHVALRSNRDHIRRERAEARKAGREAAWMIAGLIVLTVGFTVGLIWIAGLV